MKWMDEVKVLTDKYEEQGVKKGEKGLIIEPEIVDNKFNVVFFKGDGWDFVVLDVFIGHIRETKESEATDKDIKRRLPNKDASIWCKVEDGIILNLKGERKNTIPYDYIVEYYKKEQTN